MKKISIQNYRVTVSLALALLTGLGGTLQAQGNSDQVPPKKAVVGEFDWSIVTPNLPSYIIPGMDGDLYLRNMPLVGIFKLSGPALVLNAKISVQLNGELDGTGTGVLWAPVVLTATISGAKTIIFEGVATADTVGLVSKGKATLQGRGPYEGAKIEFAFEEIGGANSDHYTFKGELSHVPQL